MAKNEKTDLEVFQEIVDDIWELVFGTPRRPEIKEKQLPKTGLMTKKPINLKKMTKKQIKSLMDKAEVKYNPGDTKNDLIQKLEWNNNDR